MADKKSASPFSMADEGKSGGIKRTLDPETRKTVEAAQRQAAQRYGRGRDTRGAADDLFQTLSQDPDAFGEHEEGGSREEHDEDVSSAADDLEEEIEGEESDEEHQDEEDDEDVTSEEDLDEGDDTFEVVVNGETQEVTLDELLAGYSRQADYTRKTQELAEQRRSLQSQAGEIQQARQEYANRLAMVEQALTEQIGGEPDWDKLEQEDPAEYARQWARYQREQQKIAQLQQERQRVAQEYETELRQQFEEHVERERQQLWDSVPEWSDEAKRTEDLNAMRDYALQLGYSQEDLEAVSDHRVLLMLRKAMLYDNLTSDATKEKIRKKKSKAKTVKPGQKKQRSSKRTKARQTARERVRKTGHVRDAALAIQGIIADE